MTDKNCIKSGGNIQLNDDAVFTSVYVEYGSVKYYLVTDSRK